MKARRVRGLKPDASLRRNAARIVAVRLDELYGFDPAIRDPANVTELHDMRIAAKRLRYVLEITGLAFGPEARDAEKTAKWLQEVLGDIHDCDVLLPLLDDHLALLRREDGDAVLASRTPVDDLAALAPVAAALPNHAAYRGVATLAAAVAGRRRMLHERLLDRWDRLLRDGWRDRLEAVMGDGAGRPGRSSR